MLQPADMILSPAVWEVLREQLISGRYNILPIATENGKGSLNAYNSRYDGEPAANMLNSNSQMVNN